MNGIHLKIPETVAPCRTLKLCAYNTKKKICFGTHTLSSKKRWAKRNKWQTKTSFSMATWANLHGYGKCNPLGDVRSLAGPHLWTVSLMLWLSMTFTCNSSAIIHVFHNQFDSFVLTNECMTKFLFSSCIELDNQKRVKSLQQK